MPPSLDDALAGRDPGLKAWRSGTHRARAPAETVARVRPLMAAMGITRVANVTGLDRIGIPVVMVCRPNSRSVAVSQGKGLDLEAAKASGLMEAAETWHAERIALPLRLGSYEELAGDPAGHRLVDVERLPRVPESRLRPSLPMLWIAARDLLAAEVGAPPPPTWLPYETVHANFTLPLPPGSGCFPASTNGLASGNHPLEALCHAICEVVERDAMSLWHRLDRPARDRTRLDLGTVDDGACLRVLDALERAGFAVAAWDVTTDIGVPSFHAAILDRRREAAHPGAGAGCHPSRGVALLRALLEAVQVRTTYITGARDDLSPDEYAPAVLAERLRGLRALMASRVPGRDFRAVPSHEGSETFADDLRWLLARLRAVGVEQALAVDLTRPDFALSVVRVVIPGLEGADDDCAPGPRALAAGAADRSRRR